MAQELVTTRGSVTVYDLTVLGILNDGPTPVNSANEISGMFLRSRIDWTNDVTSSRPAVDAKAGASSAGVANIFQVVKIPDRTILHELMIAAPGSTAPTHSLTGSLGSATKLYFQVAAWSNASKSTLVYDADGLGVLALTQNGGAIAGFPTIVTSTPETRMKAVTVSSVGTPILCEFGGYVEMQIRGGTNTSAISVDGLIVGTMELVVRASKLPE